MRISRHPGPGAAERRPARGNRLDASHLFYCASNANACVAPDGGSILDVGIECGAVDKKGAWLQFNGELIGQGKDAAKKALAEKPELAKQIIEAILAKRAVPVATEKAEKS